MNNTEHIFELIKNIDIVLLHSNYIGIRFNKK